MNEMKLIALYYYVCERYDKELFAYCLRLSNNQNVQMTDAEMLTLYLYAMMEEEQFKLNRIHRYAQRYLHSWFPKLPSYVQLNRRLNELGEALRRLVHNLMDEQLQAQWPALELVQGAVDSLPIMLARGQRAKQAKVAGEVADVSLCKAKWQWYYGIKLHLLSLLHERHLPIPLDLRLSPASASDNTVFKDEMAPDLRFMTIFADKIYDDRPHIAQLQAEQNILLLSGQRRRAYQKSLHADQKILSQYVSRRRQPIESFFNWLIERAQIQIASKVRSLKGLMVFVFGRLAAALAGLKFADVN